MLIMAPAIAATGVPKIWTATGAKEKSAVLNRTNGTV